jgi:ketosteroid isomerase-like protein
VFELKPNKVKFINLLAILLVFLCQSFSAQTAREIIKRNVCTQSYILSGVNIIDVENSDRLYSVIEGASSKVPFADQQQFFIDLAVRLTPPDLLAIECSGSRVFLGSSRSRRVEFLADGVLRNTRDAEGNPVRTRIALNPNNLIFTSSGKGNDNLSFTFTPIENGRRLRVTRRISAEELIEPVIIQTVYNKISNVARWDIYGEAKNDERIAEQTANPEQRANPVTRSNNVNSSEVSLIRDALVQWIDATNSRNIEKQMSFYMPQLQAFYLARNASKKAVRIEKTRAFAAASSINIRAEEPEIVFQDKGQTAIMRFRKKYNIQNGARTKRGEVVQELRWRKTGSGWRIFSERDIKVLS